MIREATPEDIDGIVELLRESSEFAGYFDGRSVLQGEWSPHHAKRLAELHIYLPNAITWILCSSTGEVSGILMVSIFTHPFGDFRVAAETVWYLSEAARRNPGEAIRMLRMYEEWARSKGCKFISMKSQECFPQVSRLYKLMKYSAVETTYMRAL